MYKHIYISLCVLSLGLFAPPGFAIDLVIELGHAQLQQQVEKMFPTQYQDSLFQLQLRSPEVSLQNRGNRIGLSLAVHAQAQIADQISLSGKIAVDGQPRFDSGSGEIFLDDVVVEALDIDSVSQQYTDQLRVLAQGLLKEALDTHPIYVLNNDQRKIMGYQLKDLSVRNGKLIVELR